MANIFQEQVVAQKPKAIAGEQVMVYVPRATNSSPGIATYDPTYFNLVNGEVYLKTNETDRDPTVRPSLILIEPNGAGGLIYDDGYLKTSLKTINNQSLIKLLDSADGNINLATKSEFDLFKTDTNDTLDSLDSRLDTLEINLNGLRVSGNTLIFRDLEIIDTYGKVPTARLHLDTSIQSNSTNAVTNQAIYNKFLEYTKTNELGSAAFVNTGLSYGDIPVLDITGKLPASILPATAITNTYVASSQAQMLALNAQEGDVCIRTDLSRTYILRAEPANVLSNWQELLSPTSAPVITINGYHGVVVLTAADVGAVPSNSVTPTYTSYIKNDNSKIELYQLVNNGVSGFTQPDNRIKIDQNGVITTSEQGHSNFADYSKSILTSFDGKVRYKRSQFNYVEGEFRHEEEVLKDGEIATASTIGEYTLAVANWSSNQYTLSVVGKNSSNHALVSNSNSGTTDADVLANAQAISDANIYRIIDNGDTLTLVCENTPSTDLKIQVEVFD